MQSISNPQCDEEENGQDLSHSKLMMGVISRGTLSTVSGMSIQQYHQDFLTPAVLIAVLESQKVSLAKISRSMGE